MRNRYQKPQHEVFVKAMIEHDDPTKAYRIAYPNVSLASAQAAGSRLYARPDIRGRITPALEEKYRAIHKEAMILAEEAGRLRAEEICRKRRFLAMVVRFEVRKRKAYKTKEGLLIVQEDPSHDTVIRAIELDLRLQDGYPRKDLIEKQFNRILRDLSPSPRHGIIFTAEELMKDEPDVMLLSEPQIELIRLKNTDANEKTSLHRQQLITNSEPQIKLIKLNKTNADEKTNQDRQHPITNSVACPPHGGGKGEEKTPSVQQQFITTERSEFISSNQKDINLRINSECDSPPPNPRQRGTRECSLEAQEEKTSHHRQLSITNPSSHEGPATIENQINQSDLRFRQEEKTPLRRQHSITNSEPKFPTILKLKSLRSNRRKRHVSGLSEMA